MEPKHVVRFYEEALKQAPSGCCEKVNAFTASAGYGAETLAGLPADAAANSFGCGNPLAFAGVESGQWVLDLGCGAGIDLILAARKVGPSGKVIGVDLSAAMLERAQKNLREAGLDWVELHQSAIESLPLPSGSVDWVISNCVINLSPDKKSVFREIHRVLKIGGRMLVSDMIADGLPEWITADAALHAACLSGALSEADYLAAVRAAGLTDTAVVSRFTYDDAALRALITEALPISLEDMATRLGTTPREAIEAAVAAASSRVHSVQISAVKHG